MKEGSATIILVPLLAAGASGGYIYLNTDIGSSVNCQKYDDNPQECASSDACNWDSQGTICHSEFSDLG